jgi:hypothetical protein
MSKKNGSANPERAGTLFESGAENLAYLVSFTIVSLVILIARAFV